jgi:lipoprotein-releasing system permease protein
VSAYPLFLGLRYSFGRQRSRFTSLVSLASMVGMVLGVASLITVLSVMNGFGGELRQRILALVPHAYVEGPRETDWASLSEALLTHPEVRAAAPFVRETALLSGSFRQQGAQLFGIDIARQDAVTPVSAALLRGTLEDLERPFSIILGVSLARALGVAVGDSVRVILPDITVTPLGSFPRTRRLEVVGVFEVGAQQDASLAFLSRDSLARLLRRGGVYGLQLRTADLLAAPALRQALGPLPGEDLRVIPWSETQGTLFRAVRMEKITVAALLFGVVVVAAFSVIATLVMAVTEKRRDIAVLRTMGATPAAVMGVFLIQGLALAGVGILAGALLGVVLASRIDDVVAFVERAVGAHLFDPSVYFITRLPSDLQWQDVRVVVAVAAALSLLASVYPAWRASRVAPAEVLRYE